MNPVATLFSKAMSYAAVYGSIMPTDSWDVHREQKAREYAAQAVAEVTAAQMDGADSMLGSLG